MTGAYLRVQRDGKWCNVEVEHLTDEERADKFEKYDASQVLMWLNVVCKSLVEAQSLLDGLVADGILEKG